MKAWFFVEKNVVRVKLMILYLILQHLVVKKFMGYLTLQL